jgi:hypothetical protein
MDPLRANAGDTLSEAIWSIAAQKERSTMRGMYRIASLLVAVTYAQMRAMGWEVLDSVEDIPANPRTFVAHRCTRPIAREPLVGDESEEQKRRFFSITNCVLAVVWNTAWLAHLVEGNIQAIAN